MCGKDGWFFFFSPFQQHQWNKCQHWGILKLFACRSSRQIMKPGFESRCSCHSKHLPFKAQSSRSMIQPAAAEPHRAPELTVMTDTPAEVLLSLGPVLKFFLSFPATDNWFSFSDTPSSWEMQANVSDLLFTCRFRCDSDILNLHWPTDDRAPARLYISDPPPPVASQWSQPRKTWPVSYNGVFQDITDIHMVYNVRLLNTNLGAVRHIVPVRCWEIKQALQNLLEESFLVITAAG